mmetsp:Transcript_130165/g.376593  ORF Transcript_130165/g.376593 Transcript_130165/m.376593 type:complete len:178 (-) Transcript_130165:67-600(-)
MARRRPVRNEERMSPAVAASLAGCLAAGVVVLVLPGPSTPLSQRWGALVGCVCLVGIAAVFAKMHHTAIAMRSSRQSQDRFWKEFNSTCPVSRRRRSSSDSGEGASCAVCLEPMRTLQLQRVLRCGHTFHCQCIDSWCTRGGTSRCERPVCPLCREPLVCRLPVAERNSSRSVMSGM